MVDGDQPITGTLHSRLLAPNNTGKLNLVMITEFSNAVADTPLGMPVDPGEIDAGLLELWKDNETATRASLMNLAIVSESPGALLENTRSVYRLTLEHACRVILIEALTQSAAKETEAWITAHCSLGPDGGKAVCCEQLAFRMHGYSPARLTNLLFANLESDLPLVLWWQTSLNSHFDQRIYSRIDRLLIDSQSWADPQSEFERLMAVYQHRTQYFVIHDLNWTRTFHLRLAIAAGFEDGSALEALDGLQSIEIHHGPEFATTAYLLAAWILERLQLGGNNAPRLSVSESPVMEYPIERVIFTTERGPMVLHRTDTHFYTWEGIGSAAVLPFSAGSNDVAELLTDQLGRGGNNGAYLPIAQRALSLMNAAQSTSTSA